METTKKRRSRRRPSPVESESSRCDAYLRPQNHQWLQHQRGFVSYFEKKNTAVATWYIDSQPRRRTQNRIRSLQVTCGPITAEPVAPPAKSTPPAKGKLIVPLTKAEKEHKRLIQAHSYKNIGGGGGSNGVVGGGGTSEEQEPVEFMHLKTWGRNYAVLQVGVDWALQNLLFWFTISAVS